MRSLILLYKTSRNQGELEYASPIAFRAVIVLDWGNVGAPWGSRGCIGAGSSDFRSGVEWIWLN